MVSLIRATHEAFGFWHRCLPVQALRCTIAADSFSMDPNSPTLWRDGKGHCTRSFRRFAQKGDVRVGSDHGGWNQSQLTHSFVAT